ncbi:leucine-rich repeat protein, partial [Adlercreutzia caecimuris]
AKLKTVGKSAFAGCKKLKSVSLKTTKLKSVGKNALKGTAKKLAVKVPKSKVRVYQKLFKSKGSKTVRVTK